MKQEFLSQSAWNSFLKSGRIQDYLAVREAERFEIAAAREVLHENQDRRAGHTRTASGRK